MFALRAVVLLVRHVLVERAKERETDQSLLSVCVWEVKGCREQRLCDSGRDGSMLKHGSSIRFNTYRFVCRTKCGSAAWKKKEKWKKKPTKKQKNTGFNHSVCWTSPAAPQMSAEDTAAHKYSIYGYLARTFSLLHNTETTYTHKTTYVYLSWWLHSPLWRAGWPPITIRWRLTRLIINSPVLKQHREVTGGRWGEKREYRDSPAGVTELGNVVCLLFSFFVCF